MRNCGDCGTKPGDHHFGGCDMERCPRCGGQAMSCPCIYVVNGMDPDTLEVEHPNVYATGPTKAMEEKWDAEWDSRRIRWTGEYPGTAECREYGFWAVFGPGLSPPQVGWVAVPAGTPGATEDLNRLARECRWDADKQRWVKLWN